VPEQVGPAGASSTRVIRTRRGLERTSHWQASQIVEQRKPEELAHGSQRRHEGRLPAAQLGNHFCQVSVIFVREHLAQLRFFRVQSIIEHIQALLARTEFGAGEIHVHSRLIQHVDGPLHLIDVVVQQSFADAQ